MNSVHRNIIKDKCHLLTKNVCFQKIEPLLKEYKIFNKYMWEDIKTVSDVFDALPCRGPKAFQNIIEILRKAGYNQEADILIKPNLPSEIQNTDLFYKMSSKPLGYCLIVNNMDFKNAKVTEKLEYRHGSDVDANSLRDFFLSIDFVVIPEENKTAEKMKNCIEAFSERDFSTVDAMVLIILSHGGNFKNKDFIYGTDGGKVFKDDIYDYFSNKKCENLQNKPKIFFFIACRGKGTDYGVPEKTHKESIDGVPVLLPSFTDMYIIHSSLPYNMSIRHHDKGSFFCEALVNVLKEYHEVHDLETMIKFVNSKLKNKVSEKYRIVQVAHSEDKGGTKKIMLSNKLIF